MPREQKETGGIKSSIVKQFRRALRGALIARPQDTTPLVSAGIIERAFAAYQRGDWTEAEHLSRMVLESKPDSFDALNLLGIIAAQTHRTQEAIELLSRAVSADPDNAGAHTNFGNMLCSLKRPAEALASFDRAIALDPDSAPAYVNRGNALQDLKRHAEAIASYGCALALAPDPDAYNNCGNSMRDLKRLAEAVECYRQALHLKPDYEFLYGIWLHSKLQICDWSNIADESLGLTARIEEGQRVASPFSVLAITNSLAIQRKAAEIWVQSKFPPSLALPDIAKRPRHDKIRIGYFSADFRDHAVSHLLAELFERHDRRKFHLTAFAFGADTNDAMRGRLSVAFDQFLDVHNHSDREVATLAREQEIDIAVDLGGFTQDSRTAIFAMRAAPIQVNYLGYPGTMGAGYIDYLIADSIVVPKAQQHHYAEKIAYLPNSFQINDTKQRISDGAISREELGLPSTGFVFCCFNNSYKVAPNVFDSWMRILNRVESSVLWLRQENEWASKNLWKEAARRGVSTDRIIFAKRLPMSEHFARHRVADLFLDTLPYNAHATANDALWAGLPVLTLIGETFPGRVAASLLNAIRLPELITNTPEEYERLAVELATNPDTLREIRVRLANNRLTTPLFDIRLFTAHIEAAYAAMYERYQDGLSPDHIYVPA